MTVSLYSPHPREFSVFESAPPEYQKAVFVISSPIMGPVEDTLKAIIEASKLHYCVVISACHPAVLSWARQPTRDWGSEDPTAFHRLEEQLLHWMGNLNYTAEVLYLPLGMFSPLPSLLLAPSCSLLPLLAPDQARCGALWKQEHPGQNLPSEPGSWATLPLSLQTSLRLTAASLHSLLTTLGAREEIWSLGSLAATLGDQLEGWAPARARRKTAQNKVSLILVDRTLDLSSCCTAPPQDTLLGRATDLLPRLPGHSTDLQVDLSRLFLLASPSSLVPAGLASPGLKEEDRAREEQELQAILLQPEKEALALLHNKLCTASPKRKERTGQEKKFVSASTLQVSLTTVLCLVMSFCRRQT